MSFSCHAKRARDPEVPFAWRVSSVRSCVERYGPLGFHATLAFVASQVGPLRRDEATMLASLELLERSRQVWRREKEEFAALRKAEKAVGRRTLGSAVRNVYRCDRWHADPQAGAAFAVGYWRRVRRPALMGAEGDPVVPDVDALVDAYCFGAASRDPAFATRITAVLGRIDGDRSFASWDADRVGFSRRGQLMEVLHHLTVAVAGAEQVYR
ncbi:hypothetical protein [Catenulispora subtropica]|uniref:Uncharacterized protein n=1 Tax=Catenulispora subtropica TaxID=450798 RepID=A0ABN2S256_9ACTN